MYADRDLMTARIESDTYLHGFDDGDSGDNDDLTSVLLPLLSNPDVIKAVSSAGLDLSAVSKMLKK